MKLLVNGLRYLKLVVGVREGMKEERKIEVTVTVSGKLHV